MILIKNSGIKPFILCAVAQLDRVPHYESDTHPIHQIATNFYSGSKILYAFLDAKLISLCHFEEVLTDLLFYSKRAKSLTV
ncbi:MAG: hypothetical protein A2464_06370 [Deltaproteobacteria bacterium RIFOXYC2_FULL_48_10]|nr:MAG: hypothetical protein A2464_06370 [Deltaproteobacteria bacterium RIFOXYC2_FULL_48_10]